MPTTVLKGVIHGKTIELEQELGLPDGQEVSVKVEPVVSRPRAGEELSGQESLRRVFGAWAEDAEELDKFLGEIRRLRKMPRRGIEE